MGQRKQVNLVQLRDTGGFLEMLGSERHRRVRARLVPSRRHIADAVCLMLGDVYLLHCLQQKCISDLRGSMLVKTLLTCESLVL